MGCIDSNTIIKISCIIAFIIFILAVTLICVIVKIIHDRNKKMDENVSDNNFMSIENPIINPNFIRPSEVTAIPPRIIDPIKDYDYHKLSDPLETPTTRVDRYLLGPIELRGMFNYPVRGYPDNPRWLGILVSDDDHSKCADGKCSFEKDKDNKILKLFGRQKFPGSNQYDYYTMLNSGNDQIKVRLHHKKELYDDDHVHVSELGKKYKVKLNQNDDDYYNPYF